MLRVAGAEVGVCGAPKPPAPAPRRHGCRHCVDCCNTPPMPAFFRRKVEARLAAEARAANRGCGPCGPAPLAAGGVTYGPCFSTYRPLKETLSEGGSALKARRGGEPLPWLRLPERRTNVGVGAEISAVEVPELRSRPPVSPAPSAPAPPAPADEWAMPGAASEGEGAPPPLRCPSESSSNGSPSPRSSPESVLPGQGPSTGAGGKPPRGRRAGRRERARLAASPVRAWFRSSFGRP